MANDFDETGLEKVEHRPWPLPDGPWVMTQTWHDLLFAHWALDPSSKRLGEVHGLVWCHFT